MDRARISRVFYYEGLSFGLFIGVVLFSIVQIAERFASGSPWWEAPGLVLMPAFLAAYFTLRGVAEQARSAQDSELERVKRAERSVRSMLPHALSELSSHSKSCLAWYDAPNGQYEVNWAEAEDRLKLIGRLIEHSDKETGDFLAALIAQHQVARSRLKEALEEVASDPTTVINQHSFGHRSHCASAVRWASIGIAIDQAFDYARAEQDGIESALITREDVVRKIRFSNRPGSLRPIDDPAFGYIADVVNAIIPDKGSTLKDLV